MMRHEIHRRQVTEDLVGHLRLTMLIANGVTFPANPPPPKPGLPTFERLMGREPVPFMPGQRPAEQAPEEMSEAAARAHAMVTVAGLRKAKRGKAAAAAAPPPPELLP